MTDKQPADAAPTTEDTRPMLQRFRTVAGADLWQHGRPLSGFGEAILTIERQAAADATERLRAALEHRIDYERRGLSHVECVGDAEREWQALATTSQPDSRADDRTRDFIASKYDVDLGDRSEAASDESRREP